MNKVYINGKIVAAATARVSIFDRGYLYGEGVFETLRVYGGQPAFADLHYARLQDNCRQLRLSVPLKKRAFCEALARVIRANKAHECALRVTVTGAGSARIERPRKMPSTLTIFARPLRARRARLYAHGASIILVDKVRAESPLTAAIKSTSYLTRMLAREEVRRAHADEGIVQTARGELLEGTFTNCFFVRRGRLETPPCASGVLPGVTRSVVIAIADGLGIPCRERRLHRRHLEAADELFLTGSTTEILPIATVRRVQRFHAPGPITQRISEAYTRLLPCNGVRS